DWCVTDSADMSLPPFDETRNRHERPGAIRVGIPSLGSRSFDMSSKLDHRSTRTPVASSFSRLRLTDTDPVQSTLIVSSVASSCPAKIETSPEAIASDNSFANLSL